MVRKCSVIVIAMALMLLLCGCGKCELPNENSPKLTLICSGGTGAGLFVDKSNSVVYIVQGDRLSVYYIIGDDGNPKVARYNSETKELY